MKINNKAKMIGSLITINTRSVYPTNVSQNVIASYDRKCWYSESGFSTPAMKN